MVQNILIVYYEFCEEKKPSKQVCRIYMLLLTSKLCTWSFPPLHPPSLLPHKHARAPPRRRYIFFNGRSLILRCIDIYAENL